MLNFIFSSLHLEYLFFFINSRSSKSKFHLLNHFEYFTRSLYYLYLSTFHTTWKHLVIIIEERKIHTLWTMFRAVRYYVRCVRSLMYFIVQFDTESNWRKWRGRRGARTDSEWMNKLITINNFFSTGSDTVKIARGKIVLLFNDMAGEVTGTGALLSGNIGVIKFHVVSLSL